MINQVIFFICTDIIYTLSKPPYVIQPIVYDYEDDDDKETNEDSVYGNRKDINVSYESGTEPYIIPIYFEGRTVRTKNIYQQYDSNYFTQSQWADQMGKKIDVEYIGLGRPEPGILNRRKLTLPDFLTNHTALNSWIEKQPKPTIPLGCRRVPKQLP